MAELEIVKQIARWLLEQIDYFQRNVGKVQEDYLNRYQERLDTANKKNTNNYEIQKNVWQSMQ
ncbi:hypothetical protein NIES2101_04135 [Calothrix sp. HK-06]|nr:hypothetical protein NIES2101_04135 [Calothrix sp. HK-06]